jgi:hypothetical protein
MIPWIHSDFHASDDEGRMYIGGHFALDDIARQQIDLADGLKVLLYDDDATDSGEPVWITVPGTVRPGEGAEWVVELHREQAQQLPRNARPEILDKSFFE